VLTYDEWLALQQLVRRVPVADEVVRYAMRLARSTRPGQPGTPDWVNRYLTWGAGPRASQFLVLGAKAWAVLQGRAFVSPADIAAVAFAVLRHRIVLNFNAEAEGLTADAFLKRLMESIPIQNLPPSQLPDVFATQPARS
jgi:MoxR-like ATPase